MKMIGTLSTSVVLYLPFYSKNKKTKQTLQHVWNSSSRVSTPRLSFFKSTQHQTTVASQSRFLLVTASSRADSSRTSKINTSTPHSRGVWMNHLQRLSRFRRWSGRLSLPLFTNPEPLRPTSSPRIGFQSPPRVFSAPPLCILAQCGRIPGTASINYPAEPALHFKT